MGKYDGGDETILDVHFQQYAIEDQNIGDSPSFFEDLTGVHSARVVSDEK